MKLKKPVYKYVIAICIIILAIGIGLFLILNQKNETPNDSSSQESETSSIQHNGDKLVPKDNIETLLLIGVDKISTSTKSESHESGTIQADFLMLFAFDNDKKEVSAIQINRDTMTDVNRLDIVGNTIGTETKQIALAYNFAYSDEGKINCRNTADAVSKLLLDTKIDHYISVAMDAVPVINDFVGGVEVTIQDDFSGVDDTFIKGKQIVLKGDKALQYVRARKSLKDGTNLGRMKRQRQYMDALADKITSNIKSDSSFSLKLAEKLNPYVEFNSTEFQLNEYANKFNQYTYCGIKEIKGTTKIGEEFMEFYPDNDSLKEIVLDLFYEKQTNN